MKFATCHLLFALCLSVGLVSMGCTSSSTPDETPTETPVPPEERAQEQFLQGTDALNAREWATAVQYFEATVNFDPTRWDAHMNRGIALLRMAEFRAATEAFGDAIDAGGAEESVLYFNLGNLYQERGLYDIAADSYRTSMALAGELDYETLLNLAAAYTFLSAHDEAVVTIEKAIEINPDDERGHLTRGLLYFVQEQPDMALETFDRLLASNPNLAEAHYNRGFVLLRTYRDAEALEALNRYLEVDPDGRYTQQANSLINTVTRRLERNQ